MWRVFAGNGIRASRRPLVGAGGGLPLKALARLGEVLDGTGAEWWLTYGALLGWVRQGGFIPYDGDIDIAVVAGIDPVAVAEALALAGFAQDEEWVSDRGVVNQKFTFARLTFDLFYVTREGDRFIDEYHLAGRGGGRSLARGSHLAMPTRPMQLGDISVPVPADAERYLAHLYGPQWRVPVRDWNWRFSPPNSQINCYVWELPAMGFRWLKWRLGRLRPTG